MIPAGGPIREIVREQIGEEESCSYLSDQRSTMRYRVIDNCTAETYQRLLERGWRRFGNLFFRPACLACDECRSLRVEVETFRPNRSMRRVWLKNRDLRVVAQAPSLSRQHLELYRRYHADMNRRKGWREKEGEAFDYYLSFVHAPQDYGYEILYLLGERLVCVALVDVLPRALSAVYAYYDPELRSRSLGVYSILRQVELARDNELPHLYLGYRVRGNPSMIYKANYRPHQILRGRPELDEEAEWCSSEA